MHLTSKVAEILRRSDDHGLISTEELRRAGLSIGQIRRLCADGVLERIVRGLYRIAGTRTRRQDMRAASLRHRDGVISHVSSIELHELPGARSDRPHITLPPGRTSCATLAIVHRSHLDPVDRVAIDGIPTTSCARAIVDAAEFFGVRGLERAIETAIGVGKVSVEELLETMGRVESSPGRIGGNRLRRALEGWTRTIEPDSVAEVAALRRIVDFGIERPVTQFELRDASGRFVARLDLAWPEARVAREYDSLRYHGANRTEHDELRLQAIERCGWIVRPIHRGHLAPGVEGWLHQLRTDLQLGRLAAAQIA